MILSRLSAVVLLPWGMANGGRTCTEKVSVVFWSQIFIRSSLIFFFTTGEIAVKKHKWFVDSLKHTTVVVMIDEYRTSMMCSTCGSETRKPTINELIDFPRELRKRVQRDKDRGRGLLVCQNEECRSRYHHRDVNGAVNIGTILVQRLHDGTRPKYLQRPQKVSVFVLLFGSFFSFFLISRFPERLNRSEFFFKHIIVRHISAVSVR